MNMNQRNSIQQNNPLHSQTIEPINRQDQSTINRLRAAVNNPILDDIDRTITNAVRTIHPRITSLIMPQQHPQSLTTPTTALQPSQTASSTVIDIEPQNLSSLSYTSPSIIPISSENERRQSGGDRDLQEISQSQGLSNSDSPCTSTQLLLRRRSASPGNHNIVLQSTNKKSASESTIDYLSNQELGVKVRSNTNKTAQRTPINLSSNVRNTRPGDKKYDDTSMSTTSSTSFHSARNGELVDGEATERNNVNENVRSNGGSNNGNTGNRAGNTTDDDIPPNIRELRRRLQALFADRRVLIQNFFNWLGVFPSFYLFACLIAALFILTMGLIRFVDYHFIEMFALLLAFMHYSDSARFVRHGVNVLGPTFVILRNFSIIYLLGQSFVYHTAIYQPYLTNQSAAEMRETIDTSYSTINSLHPTDPMQNDASKSILYEAHGRSWFYVLYLVTISELFVCDVVLLLKFVVSLIPLLPLPNKRRIYQWLEYSGAIYRFPIPCVQWIYYLSGGNILTVLSLFYTILKVVFLSGLICLWARTTFYLCSSTNLGIRPTEAELQKEERCSICHCEFTAPIKLSCGHIFCTEDIRTWLDKENTCPICRAIVTREDNKFRNGDSMFPLYFF